MNCWILYAGSVNECKQQNDKIMHNNSFHFVQKGNDDLNIRWKTYSTKIASQLYTKLIHRWLRDEFWSSVRISLLSIPQTEAFALPGIVEQTTLGPRRYE